MSGVEKMAVKSLGKYTDRGPFPAGGNRNTLNVAGYDLGSNYDAWNIPAMRMVIDFSQEEPLQLVIAGGQSRSEERRVGKECRSRRGPDHEKKKECRKRVGWCSE